MKIKVAFVKFGGLATGGTEKAAQCIAANLPKDKFIVDYYYCDSSPYIGSDFVHPNTDPFRKSYMESKNVRLIKFNVQFKDLRVYTHDWVNTDFWNVFDESKYDILQTARAGHPEYPFTKLNSVTQIDLITLPGMSERKQNVFKTVHISKFQAKTWIDAGGDSSNVEIIPLFDELPEITHENFRESLGLENKFIFGFHQRDEDTIFSEIPLLSYKRVEEVSSNTAFLMMGGSKKYQEQASRLGLKNFYQLPHSGDKITIHKFLQTIDAFSHGRADGETFSLAIAEAMYHGLPVVSHTAPATGHIETIGDAGVVVGSVEDYAEVMTKLLCNSEYRETLTLNARNRFFEHLSLEKNIEKYVDLYERAAAKRG